MLFRLIISFIFSLSFCFALPSVTMVETSVKSSLNGQSKELALKDEIAIESEIISDETGKAEIMFDDGSLVNIAASTQILLNDFVDSQETQNILVDMTTGTARFITGEINRKNPEAFKVNTPNATIGIRGTMISVNVSDGRTSVYLHETSGLGVVVTNKATGKSVELKTPGQIIEVKGQDLEQNKATQENSDKIIASFNKIQAKDQADQIKLSLGKVLTYPVFTASKSSNAALDNRALYTEQGKVVALNTAQNIAQNVAFNTALITAQNTALITAQNTLANEVASEPVISEKIVANEPDQPKANEPSRNTPSQPSKPEPSEPTPTRDNPSIDPADPVNPGTDPTDPTTDPTNSDPTNPQGGDTPGQTSWVDNITGTFRGSGGNGALVGFDVSSKASISNAYFMLGNDFDNNGNTTIDNDGKFEITNFQNPSDTLSGEFSEDGSGGEFKLVLANGDVNGNFDKSDLKVAEILGTFTDRKDGHSIEFRVDANAQISNAMFSITDAAGVAAIEGFHGSGQINQNLSFNINGFRDQGNNNDVDGDIAGVFHDDSQGIYQLNAGGANFAGIFSK